jgi:methylated-DNA-protein-cysteine methyltransferase-like protein
MKQTQNPSKTFFDAVYEIVALIPRGRVISYGQIARILGRPRAAREVGWAMSGCPDGLPWQRVVMKDGSIAGGSVLSEMRRSLLTEDGVTFLPNGKVDMDLHGWTPKETVPLNDLLPKRWTE